MKYLSKHSENFLLALGVAWILLGACTELYQVAWGTGEWRGEFSRAWALLYYSFIVLCIGLFTFAFLYIWKREQIVSLINPLIVFCEELGNFRWLLDALCMKKRMNFLFRRFHLLQSFPNVTVGICGSGPLF
jgi:hypothetical protein